MINSNEEFLEKFWDYYLELEREFLEIEKFIPVDSINSTTYSLQYLKLFLSICSEFDVVFKDFLSFKNHKGNPENWKIHDYENFIKNEYPDFCSKEICYNFKQKIIPFKDWNNGKKLSWWKIYNDCKHHRLDENNGLINYKLANQNNILLSFSALYQLELYFYCDILKSLHPEEDLIIPTPTSRIFKIINWPYNVRLVKDVFYVKDNEI